MHFSGFILFYFILISGRVLLCEREQPEASASVQSRERKKWTEHGQQTGPGHERNRAERWGVRGRNGVGLKIAM